MNERQITKASESSTRELKRLIQSVFSLELLRPGNDLWLVSPWLSDVPLIDNSMKSFDALRSDEPQRSWTLCEVLVEWLKRSDSVLRVVVLPVKQTAYFRNKMKQILEKEPPELSSRYRLLCKEFVHQKVLLSSNFMLQGSMNWTYRGLELLEEHVSISTNPHSIHQKHLDLCSAYPEVA